MTDREKLIDIIVRTPSVAVSSRTAAEHIADHLIANGVTIPTRCKDCKYKFAVNGHNKEGCPLDSTGLMHDDDFCSCGDEKGEVND